MMQKKKVQPQTRKLPDDPQEAIEQIRREGNLHPQEAHVLYHILRAWELYKALPLQHPGDVPTFIFHLRGLQLLIGQRILRRNYPGLWTSYTPSTEQDDANF